MVAHGCKQTMKTLRQFRPKLGFMLRVSLEPSDEEDLRERHPAVADVVEVFHAGGRPREQRRVDGL